MPELEHRLAKIEMVTYRSPDIVATSYDFVRKFARASRAYGVWETKLFTEGVRDIVENKKPKPFRLSAPGVDLYFTGITPPMPKIEDGELVFEAADLGFFILPNDRSMETISGPVRKSHLQQIADAVMNDMRRNYKVEIHRNPDRITFPIPVYGKVATYKVPLI